MPRPIYEVQNLLRDELLKQSVSIRAKDVIRDPEISMETKVYQVGEPAYAILKHRDWGDWLSPIAFASLGIFLAQAYNLMAYLLQIYMHIGDMEELTKLKESEGHEIGVSTIILCLSLAVFLLLLAINKFVPTKKKLLLKDMRKVLDDSPSIIARKTEGENL